MIIHRPAPPCAIHWIDLHSIRDDKTVLRNPHKGWYWHYIDNGYGRIEYRDPAMHPPGDYLEDFPGLNHLYLRVDWSDIEVEQDVYDWSYLDAIIDEWGARGYRFALRVCCYEAFPAMPYATPRWVRDLGCGGSDIAFPGASGTAWEPDYGDPVFLDRLEIFTRHYAAKFDGHPAVEYVDWGSYGTWGEGHTWQGSMRDWPVAVLKRHIDIHARYFHATPVLMNDDVISVRQQDDDAGTWELLNYCRSKGFGIRDDSICVEGVAKDFGYDSLRASWLFDLFWEHAPVDIEYKHYHGIKPETMRSGFPFLAALERTHASYAGFHGYPRPWLAQHSDFTAYVANRLGYWYFIEGVDLPSAVVTNTPFCLDLFWRNGGFARAYHRFTLKILLAHETTGFTYEQELPEIDNRRWMPGEMHKERVTVDLPEVPHGTYRVKIRMSETCGASETIIHLAVQDRCVDAAGYVDLAPLHITPAAIE